jgi:hypothetical protein
MFLILFVLFKDINVSEHLDRVHNVVLIKCIFGSEKPRGVGILGKGSTWAIERTKGSVYEQQGAEVDESCHSKEGSK